MMTRALASVVKASSVVVVLPFSPSISLVKATTIRPSTQGVHTEAEKRLDDLFTDLIRSRAPLTFLIYLRRIGMSWRPLLAGGLGSRRLS